MFFKRTLIWFFIITIFFFFSGNKNILAGNKIVKRNHTLPDYPCNTSKVKRWTPQEEWTWQQICEGKIADLEQYRIKDIQAQKNKDDEWTNEQIITTKFLETILLHEPYRGAISHHGVRIFNAIFKDELDLSGATISHQLCLVGCRFESFVNFNSLKTTKLIWMDGSIFNKTVDMQSIYSGRSILLRKAEFKDQVFLNSAKIDGILSFAKSKIKGQLNLNKANIQSSLFLGEGAEFIGHVNLASAKIGGMLSLIGAQFQDLLAMQAINISNGLIVRDGAKFKKKVDLTSGKINGPVELVSSIFNGQLILDDIEVTGSLYMHYSYFFEPISAVYMTIGSNFLISGSHFSTVKLTGSKIKNEFYFGSESSMAPKWKAGAKLILNNVEVGVLQDLPEGWPDEIEIIGFRYERLKELELVTDNAMSDSSIKWMKNWLNKAKRYSPQPYEQLSLVLKESGYEEEATQILYSSRDKLRANSRKFEWVKLTFLKYIIGYGYYNFWAIYWICGFTILGYIFIYIERRALDNSKLSCFIYSLDMLLPIIKLDEENYNIKLSGPSKYYFYVHKIVGYVLALFLVAGITGLTKP